MPVLTVILTSILTAWLDMFLVMATSPCRFVNSIVHLRPSFLRPASLHILLNNTFKSTDAHTTLAMASQCVVSSKRVAAKTWVWFRSGVDLCMAFKVMTTNEALLAVVASELTIS